MSLSEKSNFPLSQRFWTPSNIKILHYHEPVELRWVMNPHIYNKLYKIDAYDILDIGNLNIQLKRLAIKLARIRLRK